MRYLLILLVLTAITGCVQQQPKEEIKIGGLFGLTGFSAEWGEADRNGALLAVEETNARGGINRTRISFVVEDTKSDFTQTIIALRKLANVDDVKVVIGPTWGEFSAIAIPVAEEEKVVLISPSAGADLEIFRNSSYFFRTFPSQKFEIKALVEFIQRNGYKKTAVVFSQNAWSQNMRDMFVEEARNKGINVTEVFETKPDERDYRTIIARLKQLDIDSVFETMASESDKGTFLKQSSELRFNKQVFSTQSTESAELLNNFVEYAEGIIYTYPERSENEDEFLAKYEARFGKRPQSPNAPYAYDAANAVILALEKEPKNPEDLLSYLLQVDFDGASGHIKFDNFGEISERKFVIKMFRNGTFVRYE